MKYITTSKPRRIKVSKKHIFGVFIIASGALVLLLFLDVYIRSVIKEYPLSVAESTMQSVMESAMEATLKRENIPDMSKIDNVIYDQTKSVVSIEVDTKSLNIIKSDFVKNAGEILANNGEYFVVKIPIGTLIGNEYTVGRGPKIPFKLQFSANIKTTLESRFEEAGINNTLHTVYLDAQTEVFVVIPWCKASKTAKTNFILAQTVISGKVPEAYTNVFDAEGDTTDDLFNFGAEVS